MDEIREKTEATHVIALLWAIVNALILGRSEQSVMFESAMLTVILLLGLPVVYVIAIVPPPVPDDANFGVSGHLTGDRRATHNRQRPTTVSLEPRPRGISMSEEELMSRVKNVSLR
jgi:hypothetical protein